MKAPPTLLRCLVAAAVVSVGGFAGCARKTLPETVVSASSGHELAEFRATLGDRFGAEQLQPFDTAIQELKLEAMLQGVAGTDAREQQMLVAINGKTVQEALVLGWKARRARILGEISEITTLLERDRRMQKRAATAGAAQSAADRIKNEQDILTRLQGDLADAEQRLTGWGAALEPVAAPKAPGQAASGHAP